MAERDTLERLIDEGVVERRLRRNSRARHAVGALQTLLHWLGFDRQLNWEKYGADGDYGGATVAAVADFARRNGSRANGERLGKSLAKKILERYDALEELKQLAADVDANSVERYYYRRSADRVRVASLQTLLRELGFAAELNWDRYGADGDYGGSTSAALAAYARRVGDGGDGGKLSQQLAEKVVAELGQHYGESWHVPAHKATPAPGSLSVKSVVGNNNRQYLSVSDGVHSKQFAKFRLGLYTVGSQKPASFVKDHADALRALKVSQSEINVMIAVAENEGNLDAINTWDNAFLSFGMFQWTAGQGGAKGELPALLARIRHEDRDLFDRYCGQHGLDVAEVTPGWVYGYFTLRGAPIKTAEAKAQLRGAPWAFYFWLAGQDPAVQAMEVKHALGRLDQFYDTDGYRVDGRYRVCELVSSEYGVGLLLDNHVNRPAYVGPCLAKALASTGLGDPDGWDSEQERRLVDAYLEIRESYGRYPMTDAARRAQVTAKYLANGTISDRRGSFRRGAE